MNQFFSFMQQPSIARDIFVGLIGLCVGSFLNVLALRSLKEESVFHPRSSCQSCRHHLGVLDLIPVLSYFMLGGKCRYCKATISWQYPFVEIFTAFSFVIISHVFGLNLEGLGMLFFASTLIAVCITDFREKLIPHEITYPSMLIGLLYNGVCAATATDGTLFPRMHHDVSGCLIGVGISYMLFDFIAFYGTVFYKKLHGNSAPEDNEGDESDLAVDDQIDTTFDIRAEQDPQEEEIEVMGGGDAVLSAVIAAWLGLSQLGIALICGFLIGTLMGSVYLVIELKRQNLLHESVKPATIGSLGLLAFVEGILYMLAQIGQQSFFTMPWWQLGLVSVLCGGLIGVVTVGKKVSKPFPFGPALAAGAVVAMFYDPFSIRPGGA